MKSKKEKACQMNDRLSDLVLPEKSKVGEILTKIQNGVNIQEESDLVLSPFFDMMRRMKTGKSGAIEHSCNRNFVMSNIPSLFPKIKGIK